MEHNIESIMDDIIVMIQATEEYQKYQACCKKLELKQDLLERYQMIMAEYQDLKKYEKYIDMSEVKTKLKNVKQEVSQDPIMVEYYASLNQINDLLDQVTATIYDGLLDPSRFTPYFK